MIRFWRRFRDTWRRRSGASPATAPGAEPSAAASETLPAGHGGRRWLAVGLALVLAAGLLGGLGWGAHLAAAEYAQQLDELRERQRNYQRLVERRPLLAGQLESAYRSEEARAAYLETQSPALAAAFLQKLAKQRIADAGGRLTRVLVNPLQQQGRFARVSINVRLRSDLRSMTALLHALEGGEPELFIERLVVRALGRAGGSGGQPLDISFNLVGYMRQGAS